VGGDALDDAPLRSVDTLDLEPLGAKVVKRHGLRVLWADSLRWHGFKRALELPDRPDLADPQVGGPLARRLALEGFDCEWTVE
jgi:hypothetical protein